MGDSVFFRTLRTYAERFAYGNAATRDFQSVVEETAGQELGWFFDQWVYRAGHPVLLVDWSQEAPEQVDLVIEQVQASGPVFTAPVEVELAGKGWSVRDTVWLASRREEFRLAVPTLAGPGAKVETLRVDPDAWLLAEVRSLAGATPGEFALGPPFPNPARRRTTLRLHWGASPPGRVSLRLFDVRGRRVRTLLDRPFYGTDLEVVWDGRDERGAPVPPGVYLAVLRSRGRARTRKIVWLGR